MRLSFVMPTYNEEGTVAEVIERSLRVDGLHELIVVDDGSTDGTPAVLRNIESAQLRVFTHSKNQGKGAALRTGFAAVTGDVVVIQDADLEYDPDDIPALLKPILDGHADVVFGSRFLGGRGHRVLFYWHSIGNRFLTTLSNMLTDLNLTDMEVGYKLFRREVLDDLNLKSNRFGCEPEMTAKFTRRGWRIYEVAISYHGRDYSQGKKISWLDGVAAVYWIIRFRFFD